MNFLDFGKYVPVFWGTYWQTRLSLSVPNNDSQFLYHQYNTLLGISSFSVTQPVTSQHRRGLNGRGEIFVSFSYFLALSLYS